MSQWEGILHELRESVRQEATASPLLFADFARIERYIAESYHERALIELIQNADDAAARRTVLVVEPGYSLFANDGRCFTEKDLRAICRSGTSAKGAQRKTIGYRGIGFKSTINLAGRIHIISGSLAFTFSGHLTRDALQLNHVPAMRMPHAVSVGPDVRDCISRHVNELTGAGYSTFFVFESTEAEAAGREFAALDGEALLFLRNLEELELQSTGLCRRISVSRRFTDPFLTAEIADGQQQHCWLVYSHSHERATALAVPLDRDGRIMDDPGGLLPVHCFLPTQEVTGYPFRVNADFSTDPSRTRITFDDRSALAVRQLGECVVTLLSRMASFDTVPESLANMFSALVKRVGFSRIGEKLRESIKSAACALEWLPGDAIERRSVRVRPPWLNPSDYARLLTGDSAASRAVLRLDSCCPEFMSFLSEIGVPLLPAEVVRQRCAELSELGLADVIAELAEQLRVAANERLHTQARSLPLWPDDSGQRRPAGHARAISTQFQRILAGRLSPAQLQKVKTIWDVPLVDDPTPSTGSPAAGSPAATAPIEPQRRPVGTGPVIRRWRRCEENVQAVLRARSGATVNDVSKSNLGYDLEVIYGDGRKDYVEVKELSRDGAEFALTSNEYATASALGSQYVVAVCVQDENGFAWALIRDPIASIAMVKRCRQWEWVCASIPRLTEREDF